ncbi:hypothetical protein KKB99_05070 [bacterium]|nr:hypothetical protein [bacterium]MBU1025369.1 hypothetical protein [bacterium]
MNVIRDNIGILVIAFIVAFLIKGYVWLIDPPITIELVNIQIQARNIPEGLSVSRIVPDRIGLEMKGPKSKIEKYHDRDFTAIVDLASVSAQGGHELPIRLAQSPGRLRSISCEILPGTVYVYLGKYEEKFYTPEKIIVGTLTENRRISKIEGLPETVKVSGSVTSLNNAKKVVYEIDVNRPGDSWSQDVKFNVFGEDDQEISNLKIEPESAAINVYIIEHTLSQTIPVVLNITGTPAPDYSIQSQTITPLYVEAMGDPAVIREISKVETEVISVSNRKSDFNQEVALVSDNPDVTFKPSLVRVKIDISQVSTSRDINQILVEIRRRRDGYSYVIDPPTVNVEVQGSLSKITDLDLSLIKPSLDVSMYEEGHYTVKLESGLPTGISLIKMKPTEVKLTVKKVGGDSPDPGTSE